MLREILSIASTRAAQVALILVAAACLSPAAGCRGRRRGSAVQSETSGGASDTTQPGPTVDPTIVASGTPREQLDQFDGLMRRAGYAPADGTRNGVLGPTQPYASFPLDARRNQCYAVAVFGAPNTDVNLFLLDPRGGQAAFNVLPDEHPWLAFCAVRGGRFFVRVQAVTGEGEFFLATYTAEGRRPASLHAFFGQATPQSLAATLDANTQGRITALDGQLLTEQYGRVGEPTGFVMNEGEARQFALGLERGRCYAFASFAGDGASDVDLQVTDSTDHAVADDSSTTRDAVVRFCAAEGGAYRLNVRLPHGRGSVFTAAYQQAAAPAVGTPTAPTPPPTTLLASSSGGGLNENFALLDADMRVRGYEAVGEPNRGHVTEVSTTFPVQLERDRCYALLAVGDAGVRQLAIALLDPAGREVDRDDAGSTRPTVRACASASGTYQLRMTTAEAAGNFVFASYRWQRSTRGPFGLSGLTFVRLAEMNALLEAEGFQPDPTAMPVQGRLARDGAEGTHSIHLAGGQCYSVLVAGGEGVRDIDGTLIRGSSTVESETTTRSSIVSLRHCVGQDADFDLHVRAVQGHGPYVFQIFTRANAD